MLRNQGAIREALYAIAEMDFQDAAEEEDFSVEVDQGARAVAFWVEGIADALPTREQARALVEYLTLLVAFLWAQADVAGDAVPPAARSTAALLLAALMIISRFLPNEDDQDE